MSTSSKDGSNGVIIIGVFKGMGDLLAAAPLISSELGGGCRVIVLVFSAVAKLVELLDFGDNSNNLEILIFPGRRSLRGLIRFLTRASQFRPDFVWISPHSPAAARSRLVPIFFGLMRRMFWRGAILAGADTEHFSRLFDMRVPVDRRLPLAERESKGYAMARWYDELKMTHFGFKPSLLAHRNAKPEYDIVVHPGANAANRKWPIVHFVTLIKSLMDSYQICLVGLQADIAGIQAALPRGARVQYVVGSLEMAIASIAKARVLLAMDSGTTFFANLLRVPTVALYGPVDPTNVVSNKGFVTPIYEKRWKCQPCGDSECSQISNLCLTAIEPATVAAALLTVLAATKDLRV